MIQNRLSNINYSKIFKTENSLLKTAFLPHPPLLLANFRIFFDFDNTITTCDVLDEIIKKFSINKKWIDLENAWAADEIGAKECLEGQLRGVRVTKKELCKYLTTIKFDHYFHKLLTFLQKHGVKPVILSDNFSFIIEAILKNYEIKDVKVYANTIKFYKNRLLPSFPYDNPFCPTCAHCKKIHLTKNEQDDKLIVYIGDGHSDICPAQVSDIVFAKSTLLKHLKGENRECIAYKNLGDVYNYFKGVVNGAESDDK